MSYSDQTCAKLSNVRGKAGSQAGVVSTCAGSLNAEFSVIR